MKNQYALTQEVEARRREIREELSEAKANQNEKKIIELQKEMRILDNKLMQV